MMSQEPTTTAPPQDQPTTTAPTDRRQKAAERQRQYRERRRAERGGQEEEAVGGRQEKRRQQNTAPSYVCAGEEEMQAWLDKIVERRINELLRSELGCDDDNGGDALCRTDTLSMQCDDDDGGDAFSVGPSPSEAPSGLSLLCKAGGAALLPFLAPLIPRLVAICTGAVMDLARAKLSGYWGHVRARLPLTNQPAINPTNDRPEQGAPPGRPAARTNDATGAPAPTARPA